MTALLLGIALALGVGVLGSMIWQERRVHPLDAYALRFPSKLGEPAVTQFAGLLSGLAHGSLVVFELEASDRGIEHRILIPKAQSAVILSRLHALVPGLRYEPRDSTLSYPQAIGVRQKELLGLWQDSAQPSATALLAGLGGLKRGESVCVQWIVGGGFAPAPESHAERSRETASELRAARRQKVSAPLLAVWGRVGVRAASPRRARQLVGQVLSVYRALRTAQGTFTFQMLARGWQARGLNARRRPWLTRASLINGREFAAVIGWPVGDASLPGVNTSDAPVLRADDDVPRRGRRFGTGNHPASMRSVAQTELAAMSHTLISGPTGVGKTALLSGLVADDLASTRSVVVVDGKGDLAHHVLARMPEKRLENLHVLDLGFGNSSTPLPGLSLFGSRDDAELAADLVLGVFADLFADSWGPRSEQWLRVGLTTVASDPESTLVDLLTLFWNEGYRRRMVGRVRSPLLCAAWAQFDAMSPAERANVLAAPLNKLDAVLGRSRLRAVLGQRKPAISVEHIMNSGGTLVVNLATGAVGTLAARLLGALVTYEVYRASASRARIPESRRRACMVVIDEPRALVGLPVPLDVLFEQARGHKVGLTIATQSLSQLPEGLGRAITSNVGTIGVFRQNADDATFLARYFAGMKAGDLEGLEQYELMLRLGLGNGRIARPLTLTTTEPTKPERDPRALTKKYAERVGMTAAQVDAAGGIATDPPSQSNAAPVGRKRRSQP